MATKKKAKLGRPATGRNALDVWRPRPIDRAAIEILMDRKRLDKTNVIRLALHHYVDFEGVRNQVETRAHLLSSVGA
jgi:hypothetical protein